MAEDRSDLLIGVWRLVEITNTDADGNLLPSSYGPRKMGLITFNDDHRMMVVISDGRDELPEGRAREYSSYTGRYTFDGETLRTRVDGSLPPERVGTLQTRPARIEGNRVTLTAPPVEIDGVVNYRDLTWERIA
ncbi:lipocalin-like domain-containing protein [Psychromarinibacter sp. C21-152]|uniref:Lipocalin-like domain-containing protein n=1 Tax=Psychromarinibacter sediminicola TaxID=3033385 RepID=A0AAE3T7L4_9RHOB|nr:lipocalin-like domain-containing protein [Psychromarinibacter sediminicola]MDF0600440.1 lipocalin-like domain-containing protein [Psychromarinibacter sediminicola]